MVFSFQNESNIYLALPHRHIHYLCVSDLNIRACAHVRFLCFWHMKTLQKTSGLVVSPSPIGFLSIINDRGEREGTAGTARRRVKLYLWEIKSLLHWEELVEGRWTASITHYIKSSSESTREKKEKEKREIGTFIFYLPVTLSGVPSLRHRATTLEITSWLFDCLKMCLISLWGCACVCTYVCVRASSFLRK